MFYKPPRSNKIYNLEHISRIVYDQTEMKHYTARGEITTVYRVVLYDQVDHTDSIYLSVEQFADFLGVIDQYNVSKYGVAQATLKA